MRVKVLKKYGQHEVGDIINVQKGDNYVYTNPKYHDFNVFSLNEVEILPDDPAPSAAGGPAVVGSPEFIKVVENAKNGGAIAVNPAPGAASMTPQVMLGSPYQKQFGHPEFYKLLDQMAALHSRKNHDYAGTKNPLSNLKSADRMGLDPVTGVLVRLQDKMSRLESFAQQGELLVKDESVEDTLMDLSVYALLAIILRREAKSNAS